MKRISEFQSREEWLDWYNRPATPKQIAYCESLGKYMEVFPNYSSRYHHQGDCDKWIDELKAGTYYLMEHA